jgi:hypothetical protein
VSLNPEQKQHKADNLLETARAAYERDDAAAAAAFYSDLDELLDDGGPLPRRWALMQQRMPGSPAVELVRPHGVQIGDRVLDNGSLARVVSTGVSVTKLGIPWHHLNVQATGGLPRRVKVRHDRYVAVERRQE